MPGLFGFLSSFCRDMGVAATVLTPDEHQGESDMAPFECRHNKFSPKIGGITTTDFYFYSAYLVADNTKGDCRIQEQPEIASKNRGDCNGRQDVVRLTSLESTIGQESARRH
jgi:hypothetical protein